MSDPSSEAERLRQQKIQRQLDEALADSSPASDPVSLVTSQNEDYDPADPNSTAKSTPAPKA